MILDTLLEYVIILALPIVALIIVSGVRAHELYRYVEKKYPDAKGNFVGLSTTSFIASNLVRPVIGVPRASPTSLRYLNNLYREAGKDPAISKDVFVMKNLRTLKMLAWVEMGLGMVASVLVISMIFVAKG